MVKGLAKRIRRSPDVSKLAILKAAERRLIEHGPEGIRVKHVAADLGMTDAAVHYHFGNREALISALLRFSAKQLLVDIDTILESWDVNQLNMRQLGSLFRSTYDERGIARLIFWVALAGRKPRGSGMFRRLIQAVHQARERRASAQGGPPPSISDTRFVIALLSSIHAVMPVAGGALLLSTDNKADEPGIAQFLGWVADLLDAHIVTAQS